MAGSTELSGTGQEWLDEQATWGVVLQCPVDVGLPCQLFSKLFQFLHDQSLKLGSVKQLFSEALGCRCLADGHALSSSSPRQRAQLFSSRSRFLTFHPSLPSFTPPFTCCTYLDRPKEGFPATILNPVFLPLYPPISFPFPFFLFLIATSLYPATTTHPIHRP